MFSASPSTSFCCLQTHVSDSGVHLHVAFLIPSHRADNNKMCARLDALCIFFIISTQKVFILDQAHIFNVRNIFHPCLCFLSHLHRIVVTF